jgi:hypothetical protein
MFAGMGKHSMTTLRERRAERGLVQMSLWIRDEDRAAFAAAVEPFKQRAGELDPAQRPGRKRQEAVRAIWSGRGREPRQGRPRSSQSGDRPQDRRSPCPVG